MAIHKHKLIRPVRPTRPTRPVRSVPPVRITSSPAKTKK